MTRISKQQERRSKSPRRRKLGGVKTGPKRDRLEFGYKVHTNAVPAEMASDRFIPTKKSGAA